MIIIFILLIIAIFIFYNTINFDYIGLIPEDTLIILKNGKIKKIQDIEIGEILLNDFEVSRIEKRKYSGYYYKVNNFYLTEGLPILINNNLFSINPNETENINPKYKKINKLNGEKIKYPYKYTYNLISNTNNFEIPTNYGIINNLNNFITLDEIDIDNLNNKEKKFLINNMDLFKKAFPEDNLP